MVVSAAPAKPITNKMWLKREGKFVVMVVCVVVVVIVDSSFCENLFI
jgi:hypothetical protein